MLIILGGLPGAGKTSLARALARRLGAMHLRVDTIEQALRAGGQADIGSAGYAVAQAMATENLRLGQTVIADSVNPVAASRAGWRAAAASAETAAIEIEVLCSDAAAHRHRVDSRSADIEGQVLPRWAEVLDHHSEPWAADLMVDTAARSSDEIAADLAMTLKARPPSA